MSDANLIADLARAGLDPSLLQRVVLELARAQASQEAIEKRRTADAARQANRRKSHVTSRDVTGCPVTSQQDEIVKEGPQTPKENYTQDLKNTGVRENEKRLKRAKPVGELCPENLQPNEGHRAKCREAAMPETFADMCCKRLINWSHENTHREIAYKTDWSRALHGMLDKEIEKARVGGNFSSGPKTPSRPERGSPTTAFMKRMEARNAREQSPQHPPRQPSEGSGRFALAPDPSDEGTGPADVGHRQPFGAAPREPFAQGNLRILRALSG